VRPVAIHSVELSSLQNTARSSPIGLSSVIRMEVWGIREGNHSLPLLFSSEMSLFGSVQGRSSAVRERTFLSFRSRICVAQPRFQAYPTPPRRRGGFSFRMCPAPLSLQTQSVLHESDRIYRETRVCYHGLWHLAQDVHAGHCWHKASTAKLAMRLLGPELQTRSGLALSPARFNISGFWWIGSRVPWDAKRFQLS